MKRVYLLSLLLLPFIGFSQNLIGKTKTQVKKKLQRQVTKNNNLSAVITDNDSLVVYSIKSKDAYPADFIYSFNKSGRCQSEKVITRCDSCFTRYLAATLAEKKYGWKKINENQYVSGYTYRMMIELPAESKELFYTILRTEWTKELYDMLTGN